MSMTVAGTILLVMVSIFPPLRTQRAAVKVDLAYGSHCSATLIGPNAALTATHCLRRNGAVVKVDGFPVTQAQEVEDMADHSIVYFLGRSFGSHAPALCPEKIDDSDKNEKSGYGQLFGENRASRRKFRRGGYYQN